MNFPRKIVNIEWLELWKLVKLMTWASLKLSFRVALYITKSLRFVALGESSHLHHYRHHQSQRLKPKFHPKQADLRWIEQLIGLTLLIPKEFNPICISPNNWVVIYSNPLSILFFSLFSRSICFALSFEPEEPTSLHSPKQEMNWQYLKVKKLMK